MNQKDMPILSSLRDYANEGLCYFHMPGHKGGSVFKRAGLKDFDIDLLKMDVTEVPGIDNLHCPESAIRSAQELAAEAFGAEHTFFLVNGTTGGIYSMIMAATSPGDKIIIPRNCHRSVTGAVILARLQPVYISPELDSRLDMASGISAETVLRAVKENTDAKAVVITSPTFYGVCSDLEKIAEIVHRHNMLLLVDEAHGAHLAFNSRLPKSALQCGADMVAQSTHKTLPSMTQSSMLHVNSKRVDIDKLKLFLQLTQTTSPSHILLASLDAARYIMHAKGEELLDEVISCCDSFRKELQDIKGIYCLGSFDAGRDGIYDFDSTRLTVNLRGLNISGTEADQLLRRKFKLQVEMADLYNIVAICTVGDTTAGIERLSDALKKIALDAPEMEKNLEQKTEVFTKVPEMKLLPWEAIQRQSEAVPFNESEGRISGEMIIPYPPGIPIIMPGEVITREILDYSLECMYNGIKINGVKDAGLRYVNVLK